MVPCHQLSNGASPWREDIHMVKRKAWNSKQEKLNVGSERRLGYQVGDLVPKPFAVGSRDWP